MGRWGAREGFGLRFRVGRLVRVGKRKGLGDLCWFRLKWFQIL